LVLSIAWSWGRNNGKTANAKRQDVKVVRGGLLRKGEETAGF
jgi:hypothetical protein